jgi:hypothetical protein
VGVPPVSQPAVSPISQSAGRCEVGLPFDVAQTFLSAVSRAFLPAGRRDDSNVRFLGGAWFGILLKRFHVPPMEKGMKGLPLACVPRKDHET